LEKEKVFRSQIDRCHEMKGWEALLEGTYQFKPGEGKILVIDEAQESARLGSFVKVIVGSAGSARRLAGELCLVRALHVTPRASERLALQNQLK
jgi:hypothetical protein